MDPVKPCQGLTTISSVSRGLGNRIGAVGGLLILGPEINHRVGGGMADMALSLDRRAVVVSLTEVGAGLRTQVARA